MPDSVVFTIFGGIVGLLLGGAGVALWQSGRLSRLAADRARLEGELVNARQSESQIRETFAALSRDALIENREDFVRDADALLAPMRDTLSKVQDRLTTVDKDREGSYRAVAAQLVELRTAAEGLARSLRAPAARGKWGEFELRRLVELAGMTANCSFEEKPTTTTEDGGRLTPDLVVRLPGDAVIVIDAKVPIDGYLAAAEATTDVERQQKLAAHLRQVREHIRVLAGKEYSKQFRRAPEFVVMFLPLEPLLATAIEQDRNLFEQAIGLGVIPATPLTLLALLKTVALGWRQERLAKSAEEIQNNGRELYQRLRSMVAHLQRVGSGLKQAGDAYDQFVGSLEQKVLPSARRFVDLGVPATEELESPEQTRLSLRPVTRPELTGDDVN